MLATAASVLDRRWRVAPQVAVRPEPFGALLYHFGTRRLSFLKDRQLVDVVQRLADAPTAREACRSAGVASADVERFGRVLATLAATQMLQEQP